MLDIRQIEWNQEAIKLPFLVASNVESKRLISTYRTVMAADLYQALSRVVRESETSLYVLLTTILKAELVLLSRNEKIAIVSPCIVDFNPDTSEGLNRVAICDDADDSLSFRQILEKTGDIILKANQKPYGVNSGMTEKESTQLGLLESVCLSLNTIHDMSVADEMKYSMLFSFQHNENALTLELKYNRVLISEKSVADFVKRYFMLMEQALKSPDSKIKEYSLVADDELDGLQEKNNTIKIPEDSADKLFETVVEANSEKKAVYYDGKYMTYQELNEKSNQLANVIKQKHLGKNDIVGIMMDTSHEMIIAIMAIMKAQCAYLPISPQYPRERVMSMICESNIKLLISTSTILDGFTCSEIITSTVEDTEIYVTPTREQIKMLDEIQMPDRSYVDYEKYVCHIGQSMVTNSITLQFSRGCMFKCAYCFKIWPKEYIIRSAENIFEEMKLYYDMGIRRFGFVDDLPNFNVEISSKLYQMIIDHDMKVQLHYPNGIRGDILTKDYIDLMIKAGTVNMDFALETTSRRLQKLIRKNLNIDRLKENIDYITTKYPHIVLQLQILHGIPTETEEESRESLEFLKSLKWIHFPYIHVLKIFPNTDMARIAIENGVSAKDIEESANLAYHELPTTLPFSQEFTKQIQTEFLKDYFLSKERLLAVLPHQMKVFTESELVQAYNGYLPVPINSFQELLDYLGIKKEELSLEDVLPDDYGKVENLDQKILNHFGKKEYRSDALKVLLLDVTQYFSDKSGQQYDVYEPPLGLMYLMTSIHKRFRDRIHGKIAKSRMDYDSFDELRALLDEFKPDVIGIRSMNFYSNFFHMTVQVIRSWGFQGPIMAGGPYATSSYQQLLGDENVDLVMIGEGENTINDVLSVILENQGKLPEDLMEMKQIPGLAFRSEQQRGYCKRRNVELFPMDILATDVQRYPKDSLKTEDCTDRMAYVIYTSGSTGKPKGVKINQRNLVNQIWSFVNASQLSSGKNYLLLADFTFDVSVMHIFTSLLTGGVLHLIQDDIKKTPHKLWEFVKEHTVDVLNCTPTYMEALLSTLDAGETISVPYVLIGGEAFKQRLYKKITEKLITEHIFNMYGPTETTINATMYECNGESDSEIIPIGKPLPNYGVLVVDKRLNPLPQGYIGELCITGTGVSDGYLNDEKRTEESFVVSPFSTGDRMYRTGDLVQLREDATLLFVGREDRQVKIRGFRIELDEISFQLRQCSNVSDAVVIVKEDNDGRNVLYAYIVGDSEIDTNEIKKKLVSRLPHYMVPTHIIAIPSIPYNINGKVDVKALPATAIAKRKVSGHNAVTDKIVGIWKDVLGVDNIAYSDNFFDLGGHSLNAAICITRIKKMFSIDLTIRHLFLYPTAESFSEYIASLKQCDIDSIPKAENKEQYPVSDAQLQILLADKLDVKKGCYNISHAFLIEGALDVERMRTAFEKVVEEQESFRTSFHLTQDGYVQKIHNKVKVLMETVSVPEEESMEYIKNSITTFDVTQDSLIKLFCIRIASNKSVLLFHMHHAICDGFSMKILFKSLEDHYNGTENLPSAIQYRDYSEWMSGHDRKENLFKQEQYWLERLKGYNNTEDLPLDYKRGRVRDFEGRKYAFVLNKEQKEKADAFIQQNQVTWYMFLLSVYYILLSMLTNQEDIIIGTSVSVRSSEQLEKVCGVFLNLLPMRNKIKSEQSYLEFLKEVKENMLSDFENQEYPYVELIRKIHTHEQPNRNQLFDAYFDMSNYGAFEMNLDQLQVRNLKIQYDTTKYDITLYAEETEQEVRLEYEYAKSLFSEDTIAFFALKYLDIIAIVSENPNISIGEITAFDLNGTVKDEFLEALDEIVF